MDNFNIFLLSNGILSSNIIAWWSTTDKKVWKWIILAGIVKFSKKISFFEGVGWGLLQIFEGGRVFEAIVEPKAKNREPKLCNRERFNTKSIFFTLTYIFIFCKQYEVLRQLQPHEPGQQVPLHFRVQDVHNEARLR